MDYPAYQIKNARELQRWRDIPKIMTSNKVTFESFSSDITGPRISRAPWKEKEEENVGFKNNSFCLQLITYTNS